MAVEKGDFPSQAEVASRLADLGDWLDRLSGGRTVLLPVTKAFGAEAVRAVLAAGMTDVGENYAQELIGKNAELYEEPRNEGGPSPIRWHMIGGVQRNKVQRLAGIVSLWQTVDRPELVDEMVRRAPSARILIQVDPVGTPGKGGCPPGDVEGLMTRAVDDDEASATDLAYLYDRVQMRRKRPQRYGTQLWVEGDSELKLWFVEDLEHLDERRQELNLPPVAEYLKLFNIEGYRKLEDVMHPLKR